MNDPLVDTNMAEPAGESSQTRSFCSVSDMVDGLARPMESDVVTCRWFGKTMAADAFPLREAVPHRLSA